MQNVIEQSVLDNNWLPTTESVAASIGPDFSLATLILISMLPYLYFITNSSFYIIPTIISTNAIIIKMFLQSVR